MQARFVCRVVAEETRAPIPGTKLILQSKDGWGSFLAPDPTAMPVWLPRRTDATGKASFHAPPGSYEVSWAREFEPEEQAGIEVDLAAGESRRLVVSLPTLPRDTFFRALADESGMPLAAAVATVTGWNGHETVRVTEARAEGDGVIHLSLLPTIRGVLVVEAPGRTPLHLDAARGGPPGSPLEVRLVRSAGLELRLCSPDHEPLRGLRLRLSGLPGTPLQGSLAHGPGGREWLTTTDEDGLVSWEALPAGSVLAVSAEPTWEEVGRLVLDPGERRAVSWTVGAPTVGATCPVSGTVWNEAGAPQASAVVRLSRSSGEDSCWFTHQTLACGMPTSAEAVRTGDDGRFVFAAVPEGTWWVGVEPRSESAPAPAASSIDVRPPRGVSDLELVLPDSGPTIRGRVVGPGGAPRPASLRVSGAMHRSEIVQADGRFEVGPLLEGTYELDCSPLEEGLLAADPCRVVAGADDVVLELQRGATIEGKIEARPPLHGTVTLRAEGHLRGTSCTIRQDGVFRFSGLPRATVDLVASLGDGRVAGATGLRLRPGETTRVRLQPEPSARLRIRISDPELRGARLTVGSPELFTCVQWMGSHLRELLVPPGTWTVRVPDRGGQVLGEVPTHTVAGQTTEVVVRVGP